jgi:hypothetical protein
VTLERRKDLSLKLGKGRLRKSFDEANRDTGGHEALL